jgi:hypothetical protein
MTYTHNRNWGCRISDGHAIRGLRTLVMENELLRISIQFGKGKDSNKFPDKPDAA